MLFDTTHTAGQRTNIATSCHDAMIAGPVRTSALLLLLQLRSKSQIHEAFSLVCAKSVR